MSSDPRFPYVVLCLNTDGKVRVMDHFFTEEEANEYVLDRPIALDFNEWHDDNKNSQYCVCEVEDFKWAQYVEEEEEDTE
jgi:hypothetical protein